MAPDSTLPALDGKGVKLPDFQSWFHSIVTQEMFSIFHSPFPLLQNHVGKQELCFPVLSDPHAVGVLSVGALAMLYCMTKALSAIFKASLPYKLPADFLTDGKKGWYLQCSNDHVSRNLLLLLNVNYKAQCELQRENAAEKISCIFSRKQKLYWIIYLVVTSTR